MRLLAAGVVFAAMCPVDALAQLGARTGQVFEFEEWSLMTSSAPANPSDLAATATFTPQGGGDAITTGIFYDGMQGGQHVYKFQCAMCVRKVQDGEKLPEMDRTTEPS